MTNKALFLLFLFLFASFWSGSSYALQPDEILIIANQKVQSSIDLAKYYSEKRQIPQANLLTVNMTDQEDCSREEYQQKLIEPVRKYLARRKGTPIRCLLLFYGIPLRVAAPELSPQQWQELEDLKYTK
ncbi:MAG: hypothetical protein DRH06_02250, partial [Deltaproteobacteria bacterium]